MDLRETLLGSRLRVAGTAVGGVAVLVVGLYLVGVLGVPGVTGVQNAFGPVNESTTVIETELTVSNPNPIGVTLGGLTIDYGVDMNDVSMANGTKRGLSVGSGESSLNFTTLMANEKIPAWWTSHVRRGERTAMTVDAEICSAMVGQCVRRTPVNRSLETDLMGGFNSTETRPINASAPLVSDPVAYINRTSARWGRVTADRTPIRIAFTVYNPKAVPFAVSSLGYNATMNDVAVGSGSVEGTTVIPARSAATVRTTVGIRTDSLDEWWVSHLQNDQVTRLVIDFRAEVGVGETTVRVPLRGLSHEKVIRTDIFGTKNGTDGGGPGGTTTTTGPGETDDGSLGTSVDGILTTVEDALTSGGLLTTVDDGLVDDSTTEDGATTAAGTTTAGDGGTTTTTGDGTTTDDGLLDAVRRAG